MLTPAQPWQACAQFRVAAVTYSNDEAGSRPLRIPGKAWKDAKPTLVSVSSSPSEKVSFACVSSRCAISM